MATRLQRAPSLPRSQTRNRSGIPVASREQQPPPLARGCHGIFQCLTSETDKFP